MTTAIALNPITRMNRNDDYIPTPSNDDRYTGVRSLWMKVIIRAMFDLASYKDSAKLTHKKLAGDASKWLFEPNELFNSFENVCKMLDIDPARVRRRANVMTKADVAKIEFKERSGSDNWDQEDSEVENDDKDC